MNYDPLSRDYAPRDPYSSAEQRQKGIDMGQYAHNMAQQQDRFNPKAILGASVEKQRLGGVPRELQQFEKNLNALICVIDSLDNRLASATIPTPQETNRNLHGTETSGVSALAGQLSEFNSMLSHQINRLEAIHQGIDL